MLIENYTSVENERFSIYECIEIHGKQTQQTPRTFTEFVSAFYTNDNFLYGSGQDWDYSPNNEALQIETVNAAGPQKPTTYSMHKTVGNGTNQKVRISSLTKAIVSSF